MEVTGNSGYAKTTRVYAPTRGANAYAYAEALPRRQPEPAPRPEPVSRPKAQPRPRKQLSAACRGALVFAIFTTAAAALFVMYRYSSIASAYQQVNDLKTKITESQLRVNELNVKLECAVSIDAAQAAAARLGMSYPKASQFVRAGDALPAQAGVNAAGKPASQEAGKKVPSEGA